MFEGDKQCKSCMEAKPLSMFSRLRDGWQPRCKACRAAGERDKYAATAPVVSGRLRGDIRDVAERVAEMAGDARVTVTRFRGRFHVSPESDGPGELIGVYDHGCDYRQVIGDLAA